MAQFLAFVEDYPLIGHNIARFDIPFIIQSGFRKVEIQILDTIALAQEKLNLANYQLTTLKSHYNLSVRSHNALDDVKINAIIYQNLRDNKLDPVAQEVPDALAGKAVVITGNFGMARRYGSQDKR